MQQLVYKFMEMTGLIKLHVAHCIIAYKQIHYREIKAMASILLLNGPNLNLLGSREQSIYGDTCLADIVAACERFAATCGFAIEQHQHNAEHQLIERIQQCRDQDICGIVFNPAAFTHTSIALRDALLAVRLPFVEVHLSQPLARESFRHVSFFSDIALGTVSGFGVDSYLLGIQALINHLDVDPDSRQARINHERRSDSP